MSLISNIKLNDTTISFDLSNETNKIKISLANALRRTIISDIQTYNICNDKITFFENTSMLNNEFLKHRLTLIPIISDISNISYDNLLISCKKRNDNENMENIYVNDFICKDSQTNVIINNNIIFSHPNILFGKLKHGQKISFEAKLEKNNAELGGAFYSTVSKCVYTFKIDTEQVKTITSTMDKEQIKTFSTQDIERVYQKNKTGEPNIYNFVIESIGFYQPNIIVIKGIDCLINRLLIIKTELRQQKSKKVSLVENSENPDCFNFCIDHENETVGNLLSTYITYHKDVSYCGYVIEHPLQYNIIFRIKLIEPLNNLENNILVIEQNIDYLVDILENIKKKF